VRAPDKLVLIGRIAGAHGIRGEVLIESFAHPPENVAAYGPLTDRDARRAFLLKVKRLASKGVVCRIAGVEDRTAAEALRGTELYVARARLPATRSDEFYHADLIGLRAVAPDGRMVGRVVAVQNFGAGDILEIVLDGSTRTEMVPFSDAFVPAVDLETGCVTVILPEAGGENG